ncbi:PTS system, mannose-specific IIB component [Syntrophus gentianae]|uniref:PTS system, mannose-specific IIB component n=1 Tax=Syntrophus gentianae TaxID=43775 RepID=A0A1H7XPX0_9BACT|nr:PTS sugar transporter subunit IIB [Syntrophus gentianae]SEM35227.1 PTS system, mannose-specific IIB component [Syntrophus gentianae]
MKSNYEIVLVRVDDRLIHGQILEAWLPFLKASCIIVANDGVASDLFRETVMRMAVPSDTEVIIRSIDEFSGNYPYTHANGKKTLVLFSCISDAMRAYASGFRFSQLNIGNVYSENGAMICLPSVLLGSQDIDRLEELIRENVTIELRRVPKERSCNFKNYLKTHKP